MAKRKPASTLSSLEALSAADLKAELRRRETSVRKLIRKRQRLAAQLAEFDRQFEGLGGTAGARIRKRPKNESNLVEALAKVLSGKTLSVNDLAEAVQVAGYQTVSPNFRTIVNQTLINNAKVFKRVARGQYTAK